MALKGRKSTVSAVVRRLPVHREISFRRTEVSAMAWVASTSAHDVLSGLRILYMDGSPERGRMEGLFGRGGAAVTTVSTTVEALAAFDQAKPELVISRVGVSADGAEGL